MEMADVVFTKHHYPPFEWTTSVWNGSSRYVLVSLQLADIATNHTITKKQITLGKHRPGLVAIDPFRNTIVYVRLSNPTEESVRSVLLVAKEVILSCFKYFWNEMFVAKTHK